MLALGIFQALLNAIGWVLAWIYDLVGNYGLSIILLTILIKVVLLPLGVKQIKSMQAMQAIQPKVKEMQKKYKGNKTKVQEETMKLYKEAGVNPLGGCLPLLLQFPILIAMYAVIRAPQLQPVDAAGSRSRANSDGLPGPQQPPARWTASCSRTCMMHENLSFLGMNLQCSAAQSGHAGGDRGLRPQAGPAGQADPQLRRQSELPFDATTGTGTIPLRRRDHGQDPVFRAAHRHDRHHVLPAAPDAEGEPSGRGERTAAGHPEADADHVRHLRLHVPRRARRCIGRSPTVADRAAVRPAQGRPHRAGCHGAADRRAAGEEREQAGGQAGAHGADAGARGAVAEGQGPAAQEAELRAEVDRELALGTGGKGTPPKGRRPNTGGAGGTPKSGGTPPKPGRRPNTDPQKRDGGNGGQGDGEAGT